MVGEVASNSYSYITDSADGDNPHYGPLRMVTMRNIRAGLPLNESEPGFRAALQITREYVRRYAGPNRYTVLAHRNSNWSDCEIVYWVYRNAPEGDDNRKLAGECRDYLWIASLWLTRHLTKDKENLSHQWMDERIIALAIETALTADRIGIPYGEKNPIRPDLAPFVPEGVTTWKGWIGYINGFVDRMQAATMEQFGSRPDPNGQPILAGNLRYGANGGWKSVAAYVKPYPILFFEEAMLANALLRAGRQYDDPASRANAIEMTAGVHEFYNAARHCLPYRSHGPGSAPQKQDYDLNNFWVRPLLEMYQLTGEAWMRQTALELLGASRNGAWLWRMKQAQELGSATEPQAAQALLAGLR